jgi:hypothetical protein
MAFEQLFAKIFLFPLPTLILRKSKRQSGDIISRDHLDRAYSMTHGVNGVDWKHYKHPLRHIYDVYVKYWGNVAFNGREL